jgi:MFS family permease
MRAGYFSRLRLLSRDVRLFLVTPVLVGFVAWGGIYSVLLNLYLLRLGYGPRFIGLINGAGLLASAAFSLPIGIISGRAGIRRMLIASMFLSAIGFVTLPLAEAAPAGLRSWLLLATYFTGNLGLMVWSVNANPFLIAATSGQERSHAFSLSFVLSALGAFAGSLVAGYLPEAFAALLGSSLEETAPYRYTLLSAGALLSAGIPPLVAAGRSVVRDRPEVAEDEGRVSLALVAIMSLVCVLSVFGEGTARTFFNVYLDKGLSISTSRIGVRGQVV